MSASQSSGWPFRLSLNLEEDQHISWPAAGGTPVQMPTCAARSQHVPKVNNMHTELVSLTKDGKKQAALLSPILRPRLNTLRAEVLSFTTERGDIAIPTPAVTRPPSTQSHSKDGDCSSASSRRYASKPSLATSDTPLLTPPTRLHKASTSQPKRAPVPISAGSAFAVISTKVKSFFSCGPSYAKLRERQTPPRPCAPSVDSVRATLVSQAEELLALSRSFELLSDGNIAPESDVVLKAREIIHTAHRPIDHMIGMTCHAMEAAVIRTLMHTKTLQFLPKYGGLNVQGLSLLTHVEESLLSRLLSAAVTFSFLAYNSTTKKYRHTRLSAAYADPASPAGAFFTSVYDMGLSPLVLLPEGLDRTAQSGERKPFGDNAATPSPLSYKQGRENLDTFQSLSLQRDKMAGLQHGMAATARISPYTGAFPFGRLAEPNKSKKRFALVDIGGAHGDAIAAILTAHPNISARRCMLQDRAEVTELARNGTVLPISVQVQAHDFFAKQPILGARAYHLRAVLHSQSDEGCRRILSQIVPAMASDSVVLIADNVIPADPSARTTLVSYMDLIMMSAGGKERTESDFEMLAGAVGLEVVKVWRTESSSMYGVVECRLKR